MLSLKMETSIEMGGDFVEIQRNMANFMHMMKNADEKSLPEFSDDQAVILLNLLDYLSELQPKKRCQFTELFLKLIALWEKAVYCV